MVEKSTTIRVSKKNLKKLRKISASIALNSGHIASLNDTITAVIEKYENEFIEFSLEDKKKYDRQKFISLLDQPIEGAGPEDYRELEYDD